MLDITSLQLGLPEDILKKKWAGDFDGAQKAIDARLKNELPLMLRSRLELEKEILPRILRQYPHDREKALLIMRGLVPGFTEAEFDELEANNWIDFLFVGGEKRYFVRFHRTLLKVHPDIARRAGVPLSPSSPLLDDAMREMKEKGELSYHFRIRGTLKIENKSFEPNETYRVHLPLPQVSAQTQKVDMLYTDPSPLFTSPEEYPQRTIYFEETLPENRPFIVEYAYDSTMKYVDLKKPPESEKPVYPRCPAPTQDDLGEIAPHICFTPYVKSLAAQLVTGNETALEKARKIYDFVTNKVIYSFVRSYLSIENQAEYAAVNLKGDCGLQALLFITLCRSVGIPARWQSGLSAEPESIGSHDWAQFYVAPWGWLFCDCSYGGTAYRKGNLERWDFYFGNLDPYRMAANSVYQADFDPPKQFLRADPYDNQDGECETMKKGLTGADFDMDYEMVSCVKA